MGISRLLNTLHNMVHWSTLEVEIDPWIRDALLDEALARPPAGAWERLRQAIIERKLKNYGMWVLDEPQRDPPESPPMMLNRHEYERARRINYSAEWQGRHKYELWSGIVPILSVIVSCW